MISPSEQQRQQREQPRRQRQIMHLRAHHGITAASLTLVQHPAGCCHEHIGRRGPQKKKSPRNGAISLLVEKRIGLADSRLAAGFGADDVAEQLPFLALELHHLELLDRARSRSALVLILMPGISVSGVKSFRQAACFITFSRVRLSPHCFSTCTMVCAAAKP